MIRKIALGTALAFGLATASNAAIMPVQVGHGSDLTIKVAEGCGPGLVARSRRSLSSVCHGTALSSRISHRPRGATLLAELSSFAIG